MEQVIEDLEDLTTRSHVLSLRKANEDRVEFRV